jgi:glycosyltransferase involved in cell wall biosynthesis
MWKGDKHELASSATQLVVGDKIARNDVTIVIPSLNEREGIGRVLDELMGLGYDKILVVDGYSTDGTPELAAERGIRVVGQVGKGKTGALLTAANHVSTPYMLVMDADYTYDPSCIERLLLHGSAYDQIIGARTDGREHIPPINRFGNRVLNWLFKLLFAVNLSDVCSGMYLLRTEVARSLEFTTHGFDVEVEIASQVASRGKITEVPVNYRHRLGKQKLSSLKHGIRIATSILRLANAHNPVLLYSGVVTLVSIPAAMTVAWVIYERLAHNVWHEGYALFGTMLFVIAVQSLSVATISTLIQRSERRIRNTYQRELRSPGSEGRQ